MKVRNSIRRSAAVLAVAVATFVAAGSGAQAAPTIPDTLNGIADAQADIAYMYWTGEGVRWNGTASLYWWMRAAAQGNERARHKLLSFAIAPALILVLLGVWGVVRHRRKTKQR